MTEKLSQDYHNLIRSAIILESDYPVNPVDTLYLHGLSEGMIYSTHPNLFEIASNYRNEQKSVFISFNGSNGEGMGEQNYPGAAWPGKDWYIKNFKNLTDPDCLVPTDSGLHTRDEADKFILLAKEKLWNSAGILSVSYHATRSMSCMVAAMETQQFFLDLHFISPSSTDPWYPMLGSQGISETNTFTEIEAEVSRILNYWEKGGTNPPHSWRSGYGVPPQYLFHYLRYRDEIVKEQKFPLFPLS